MLRESPKHPLARTLFALCAVIFASCLAAASDGAWTSRACVDVGGATSLGGATNFDFLVLASIADSPRFLAMAGYRSMAMQRTELGSGADSKATSRRAVAQCIDHGAAPYGPVPLIFAAAGLNFIVTGSATQ
jgi:hypothetical protein